MQQDIIIMKTINSCVGYFECIYTHWYNTIINVNKCTSDHVQPSACIASQTTSLGKHIDCYFLSFLRCAQYSPLCCFMGNTLQCATPRTRNHC